MASVAPQTIDYLEEDTILPLNQVFALVSFVSPEGRQRANKVMMKVRGVFGSRPEADAHARKLMKLDDTFDIFLLEMGKWVVVPPNLTEIENQEYNEEFMQNLMKGYQESQEAARQEFSARKQRVMQQGLEAGETGGSCPEAALLTPNSNLSAGAGSSS